MKLPRRVSINGQWWTVTRRSDIQDSGKPLAGRCLYKKRRIIIRWGLSDGEKLSTLIHEIVHACVPDLEEHAVERIEEALMFNLQRLAAE